MSVTINDLTNHYNFIILIRISLERGIMNKNKDKISKLDFAKLHVLFSMIKLEDLKVIESDLQQIIQKKEEKLCKTYTN